MEKSSEQLDIQFFQLVLSLQAAAMQQMGKIMSPLTGKIERDMAGARTSIDLIEMLQKKTVNNLSEEESKLIQHVLYELRMNFVDESKKEETGSGTSKGSPESVDTDQDGSAASVEKPVEMTQSEDSDSDPKERPE